MLVVHSAHERSKLKVVVCAACLDWSVGLAGCGGFLASLQSSILTWIGSLLNEKHWGVCVLILTWLLMSHVQPVTFSCVKGDTRPPAGICCLSAFHHVLLAGSGIHSLHCEGNRIDNNCKIYDDTDGFFVLASLQLTRQIGAQLTVGKMCWEDHSDQMRMSQDGLYAIREASVLYMYTLYTTNIVHHPQYPKISVHTLYTCRASWHSG